MWAGLVPPGGSEGESVPGLSSSFWWWPVILGVPWLVATSLQSLPPSSRGFSSVSVSCLLSLIWTLVIGFRVHPHPE